MSLLVRKALLGRAFGIGPIHMAGKGVKRRVIAARVEETNVEKYRP
jgi:hypothetical protein